jgi:HK97 family phage portal protein
VKLFGLELTRASSRAAQPVGSPVSGRGGWLNVIREPFTGAWQQNQEISAPSALAYPAIFACTTLIASDIGKLGLYLVERDAEGIWSETESPAFSPVIRKPNRYQTAQKFREQWIVSKLRHGNTYVLKQRDERGVVVALYVLDPQTVTPLVAPDGAVFYQLGGNDLAGIPQGVPVAVPAREVIHDLYVPLFHPLVGVTPIYACASVVLQGLKILDNVTTFFSKGSNPGGILIAPDEIPEEEAARIKAYWEDNYTGVNVGRVAVLGHNLKYESLGVNAVDAQLVEQLKLTTETICQCYHVPASLIDSSHQPPYANSEPLLQQYYSQCLQALIVAFEAALDEGLGLPGVPDHVYGTELDIDDLIWMDTATRTKAATDTVHGGVLSPNEARKKYFGVGTVAGGDTPYMQQQMFSIAALAERDGDAPFSKPAPPPPAAPAAPADEETFDVETFGAVLTKCVEELYA